MWYIWLTLFLSYLGFTWFSMRHASSPTRTCNESSECFKPLVSPGEPLTMELFLYQQLNSSNDYKWSSVETCRFNITVPSSGVLPVDIAGNTTTNCTVPLPNAARQRHDNAQSAQALQAKFRFYLGPVILTEARFQLTRMVERNRKSTWSSTTSSVTNSRRNLLEEPLRASDADREEPHGIQWIPYLKYGRSAIRIRFVAEYRPYGALARNDGLRLHAYNRTAYRPVIYVDDNSLQHSSQIELGLPEDNKPPINLSIKMSALSPVIDSLNQQATEALKVAESMLGGAGSEIDEIRYFLQDEKLYRFLCSQIISYVHLWLDYMAFRDEVRFYRGKQNLTGVSASSVVSRFICSFIIFLYLIDGGGTSWVVLVGLASSCTVDAWKVWKLLRPTLSPKWPFVTVRQLQTTAEKDVAAYDRDAANKLGMILFPMVLVWSVYSLYHYTYASWWSWCISNLANAVYAFGFISMCPQLYVNYRLKSVTHLPWKVFVYKIFNTFVDDAFAWLVDMPWKHRIMTLRDDVVFLLLLLQVYMYRVDKTRTNEFGYSYEEETGSNESTEGLLEDEAMLMAKQKQE